MEMDFARSEISTNCFLIIFPIFERQVLRAEVCVNNNDEQRREKEYAYKRVLK